MFPMELFLLTDGLVIDTFDKVEVFSFLTLLVMASSLFSGADNRATGRETLF